MPSGEKTAAAKILHNSMWYGLETVLETIIFFGTSIAVARYLGPQKMGYFSYINFFVSTITRTAGIGLSSATRKYMTEFLVIGKPGVAHAVYRLAYRFQLIGALFIAVTGILLTLFFGDQQFKLFACILLAAVVPGVMSWVPAEANNALEDMAPNTISALGYLVCYTIIIVLSIVLHWDLVGIACAMLIGRTAEVILRTVPLHRKFRQFPVEPVPPEVKTRIRKYCLQAVGIQLLSSIVYDRSEFFFLKYFGALAEISFYSISIGLVDKLLLVPRTFGGASSITLMAESTRDKGRANSIVRSTCRVLLLFVIPAHIGMAVVAKAAVAVAYGPKYSAAAPIMFIAALLGMPRAFQFIAETLLRAADQQKILLRWLFITGLVNLAVDYVLIKHHGAIGAAWGNGLSQGFGIIAVWFAARKIYNLRFPVAASIRFFAAGIIMGCVSFFVSRSLPPLAGLTLGILSGIVTYLVMLKVVRALDQDDSQRLGMITNRLPGRFRSPANAALNFLCS